MLSVIIVSYNSRNILELCIKSVQKSIFDNIDYEFIIINNQINEKIVFNNISDTSSINIFDQNTNIGYSKAINFGVEKSSGDMILILNPDVEILNDAIPQMYNYINKHNNVGVVGAKVLDQNGNFKLYSRRRFPHMVISISYFLKLHYLGLINYYNYEDVDNTFIQKVDSISGCCMMFRKKTFVDNKGFNENFFLYFEDTYFCWKINKTKQSVFYYPNACIIHHGGLSTKTLPLLLKYFYFYKSLLIFIIININEYKNFLINCILLLIIFIIFILNI
tara:strand:- start:1646 stop:2476 length:831 start_codon:yes stop_codon:yes gene_type:complete